MTRVSQAGRMPEPRARSIAPGLRRFPTEAKGNGPFELPSLYAGAQKPDTRA
jgi:hypothetical protein